MDIYSKEGSEIDVETDNNSKSFTVFQGIEATTLQFKIANDTHAITNNSKIVNIVIRMKAIDLISYENKDFEQRGSFLAPIRPLINNVNTTGQAQATFDSRDNRFSPLSTGNHEIIGSVNHE